MSNASARKRRSKGSAHATLTRAQVKRLLAALGEAERLIGAVAAELLRSAAPLSKPGGTNWLLTYAEKTGGKPCGLEYAEKSGPKPCGVTYAEKSGPKPCGLVLAEKSGPKPC